VAISPIIAGRAVKGPAAKMYREMGIEPSPAAFAQHFGGLLAGLVMDTADAALAPDLEAAGLRILIRPTLMQSRGDRRELAEATLALAVEVKKEGAAR
jgi:LPPG:FO 2-phospho-L-lactate transferase